MPADPRTSVHSTRSASSHGHGEYGTSSHAGHVHSRSPTTPPPAAYASSLHSYRADRDQERHHRRDAERDRDSHHTHHTHAGGAPYADAGRASHHSHRDYQPVPEPPRGLRDEQGAPPHKRWRVGGW